jgi:uncharacterized protein DUF3810
MRRQLAVIAAAAIAAVLPVAPSFVERVYSTRFYPAAQAWMTRASNAVPFALIDLVAAAVMAAWLGLAMRTLARREAWPGALGRIGVRTLAWSAALYLFFLLVWGLNYRRVPLTERLPFDAARVSPDRARDFGITAADRLNALAATAHTASSRPEDMERRLAGGFASAQRDLGSIALAVPGRPKRTLLDLYFRRAGVDGMTDPFFLETLVAHDLLPVERPFVIAHEWMHLAGLADEGEANFGGWLTCLRSGPAEQYSGWLFLFGELSRAVRGVDRAALAARLAPGPRADLRAISARLARDVNPRVSAAGWMVYDRYLKANRVERGAESYADVVRLVLGVAFDDAWVPVKGGF